MFEAMGYACNVTITHGRGKDEYTQITYKQTVGEEHYMVMFISGKDCKRFYYGCQRGNETMDVAVDSGPEHTEAIIQQMKELGWFK